MRERSIDRIRNATFSHAVRGYDRHEVDRFLRELADWLEDGGESEAAGETIRAELERIGEQTAGILTEAHDAAESIRENAAAEVRQQLVDANVTADSVRSSATEQADAAREEADAYALKTRTEADTYAEGVRAEADAYATEQRGEADAAAEKARAEGESVAERIVADANRRRSDIEAMIGDLEQRRDAVLVELERLASGISGAASQHRDEDGAEADADSEDTPAEREQQTEDGTDAEADAAVDPDAETKKHQTTR